MIQNRPRNSILSLFDPLNASPFERETNSSSPDSDKENANPTISSDPTTLFFNRAYKSSQSIPPKPSTLTHRLIDVGDATIDNISIGTGGVLGNEGNAEEFRREEVENGVYGEVEELGLGVDNDQDEILNLRDTAQSCLPKSPEQKAAATFAERMLRTPLAEIILDDEATPLPNSKIFKRHFVQPAPLPSLESITEASDSVIHNEAKKSPPEIRISSADNLSLSFSDLDETSFTANAKSRQSSKVLIDNPNSQSSAFSRHLRTNTTSNTRSEINRCSADLQSSFFMQMQSPESSFDLLHDKVSFLSQESSLESMLDILEDESFDLQFEAAKMADTLRVLKANSKPTQLLHDAGGASANEGKPSPIGLSMVDEMYLGTLELSAPPMFAARKASIKINAATAPFVCKNPLGIPDKTGLPGDKQPAPPAPTPPVSALRIIKRQKSLLPEPRQSISRPQATTLEMTNTDKTTEPRDLMSRMNRLLAAPTTAHTINSASGPRRLATSGVQPNSTSNGELRTRFLGRASNMDPPKRLPNLTAPDQSKPGKSTGSALPRPMSSKLPTPTSTTTAGTPKARLSSLLGRSFPSRH